MPTTFTNIIDVDLSRANNYSVNVKTPVHQWDTGIVLKITGVNLPTGTTVQFDSKRTTYNFEIESSGTGFLCEVPNACLGDDMAGDLMAHIHVATSDYGVVIYDVHIPVIRRMKPATYISSNDPTDETVFTAPVSVSDVANNNTATMTSTELYFNNVELSRLTANLASRSSAVRITTSGTDLNSTEFLKVGEYYATGYSLINTFLHCPTNNGFRMRVESPIYGSFDDETTAGTARYRVQTVMDIDGTIAYRSATIYADNNVSFSNWKVLRETGVRTIDSGTNLNSTGYLYNLNYICTTDATAASLTGKCPTNKAFKMSVEVIIGDHYKDPLSIPSASSVEVIRTITEIESGAVFVQTCTNPANTTSWTYGTWREKVLGDYFDIAANSDLNTTAFITPGVYKCVVDTVASTIINSPITDAFSLTVEIFRGNYFNKPSDVASTEYEYITRTLEGYHKGAIYKQKVYKAQGQSSWTFDSWNTVGGSSSTPELLYESTSSSFNFQSGSATLSKAFDQFSFILFFYEGANGQGANFSYLMPTLAIHVKTSSSDVYDNYLPTNWNVLNMLRVESDKKTLTFNGSSSRCNKLRIYGVK